MTRKTKVKQKPIGSLLFLVIMSSAISLGAVTTFSVLQAFRPMGKTLSNTQTIEGIQICEADALTALEDTLAQVQSAAANPLQLVNLSAEWREEVIAQFLPTNYPNIHDRARRTYVPIIMYHDITPVKDVDYDVTPQELADHFATLKAEGMTPISIDQLVRHLETGASLPPKPVLLTFDDNYRGQYLHAFPLLQKYNFPAVWSVHTAFVGSPQGKPKATWEELKKMADSGLVTVASHTVSHRNLTDLTPAEIDRELRESKQILEEKLGRSVKYFTYPEGTYTEPMKEQVLKAGYRAALSMSLDPYYETSASESDDLLSLRRYGQSRFNDIIAEGKRHSSDSDLATIVPVKQGFAPINFSSPVEKHRVTIDGLPLTLVFGGQPVTVHADSRYQVAEIQSKLPNAVAAVDGGFFSLEFLDSNQMIGPVLSRNSSQAGVFNPGKKGENPLLKGRPLVLISDRSVKYVPYDPDRHTSLEALQQELPDVKDAFVAAAWLVKQGKPRDAASFGKLYGFDAARDRAFWGIDRAGRPVIGVTMEMIDSVGLGQILAKAGIYEAVMLDSGASAALSYQGQSVMEYEPRPVPHVVALLPPQPAPAKEEKAEKDTDRCRISSR
ncbi:MAG: polysaccharide deacetylase [Cyanobacteria bacterium M5B4]|nr:MAG: polysaccharide deacetylase [Cyanobacteria bacterium M5B4]